MTRNEIANQINSNIKNISREIQVDELLEFEAGQIITLEKPESWSDGGEFWVETDREYSYSFRCINECPVHAVNYDNEAETEELGATGCEKEKEVLVPAGIKFRIVDPGSPSDFEDMGFSIIEVEYVK